MFLFNTDEVSCNLFTRLTQNRFVDKIIGILIKINKKYEIT